MRLTWVLYYLLPYIHAKEEIRLRSINSDITPERAYDIVLEATDDEREAEKISTQLSLSKART